MSNKSVLSKSTAKFFLGFKIYMAILLIIVFGLLLFLWISLSKYQNRIEKNNGTVELVDESENTMPDESTAQSYFSDYIHNMSESDWAEVWYGKHPERFDSENDVYDFVRDGIINKKYTFYKHPDTSVERPIYILAEDENVLSQFVLGNNRGEWYIEDAEIMLNAENSYEALVPDGCVVYLNDHVVPEQFFEMKYEMTGISDYDEDLISPVAFNRCFIDGLIAQPQCRIIGANGGDCVLGEDGHYYEVLKDGSETEYKNRADDFIKSLLNYYAKGKENAEGNMHSVMSRVASGSAAYKIINESYAGIIWRPADYSVSYTTEISNVYRLADNAYCVDISYFANSTNENSDAGDGIYRVFFVDTGKGFDIVQFAGIK